MKDFDLIRRRAAIDIAMQYCPDDDGSCSKARTDIREMLDELEGLPSVDAVEVVYCKDCEYFKKIDQFFGECMHLPNSLPDGLVNDLFWYCADGERKEE